MMPQTATATDQLPVQWQCVLICWGEKYGVDIVNRLVERVAQTSPNVGRFVLLTDRDRDGLDRRIQTRAMDPFWLQAPLKRSGCQAKLCMFEKGVLDTDWPAIYIDLDTIVLGDMGRLLHHVRQPEAVAILPSAIIPFGPVGRALHRWSHGKRYARGNSSVVVFHPVHQHHIAAEFRRLFALHPAFEFRPMVADERFISWAAQPHMRALSKSEVVKFPGEYMFYCKPWLYLKALLPWVRQRRAGLLAVTLNGLLIKPERLQALPEKGVIVDEKNRKLVWTEKTLGSMKRHILAFYGTPSS